MTKPKRKMGSPRFSAYPHTLSGTARADLIKHLALDAQSTRAADAMSKVENWLGFYPAGVKALDEAPRAAHYQRELTAIHRKATELYNALCGLDDWMCEALKAEGADVNGIEESVLKLYEASRDALKNKGSGESRGRRTNNALMQVIRELRRIFFDNYRGPKGERTKRGAFQTLSPQERAELDFLFTALRDARIIPQSNRGELSRLIKDPRCALPRDRAAVMERIARKRKPSNTPWEMPEPDPQRAKRAQRGLREQPESRGRPAHK